MNTILLFISTLSFAIAFNHNLIHDISISGVSLLTSKFALDNMKVLSLNQNATRKLVHITAAPAFMSTWQFYDSKYIAASVPIIATLYLVQNSNSLSSIISRSGNKDEIFRGPLIYTIILSLITLTYWKEDPIGLIAMTQLSIGDGFADIIGRKYGNNKWEFNKKKSVEGTIGFLTTSSLFTYFLINNLNIFENIHSYSFIEIFIISSTCSFIELFSKIDDNLSIPLTAIFTNYFLLVHRYVNFVDLIINPVAADYFSNIIHTGHIHLP